MLFSSDLWASSPIFWPLRFHRIRFQQRLDRLDLNITYPGITGAWEDFSAQQYRVGWLPCRVGAIVVLLQFTPPGSFPRRGLSDDNGRPFVLDRHNPLRVPSSLLSPSFLCRPDALQGLRFR